MSFCTACGTPYDGRNGKLHCSLDEAPIRRPDWGHGPNPPVLMFTEAEIRHVMKHHRPGNEGYCLCAWGIGADHTQEYDVDHLIDKLKEYREETAAKPYPRQ